MASSSGEDKLTIAKRAAMATVEVLNPLDQVGVLAFDAAYEWIVPPTEVGNRRGIADQLRLLEPAVEPICLSALPKLIASWRSSLLALSI